MRIVKEVFMTGKQLIRLLKGKPKIVVHNIKPDTIVEIFAKLSVKDKAEMLGFTEEKSYHKEGRV